MDETYKRHHLLHLEAPLVRMRFGFIQAVAIWEKDMVAVIFISPIVLSPCNCNYIHTVATHVHG